MFATVRRLAPFVGAASLLVSGPVQAQFLYGDVAKSLEYQQTGPSSVSEWPGGGAGANAFFYARGFAPVGAYDGGTLTFAGPASPQPMTTGLYDCCGARAVGYQSGWMTPADMDANFPSGVAYSLNATDSSAVNPPNTLTMFYSGDSVYSATLPALTAGSFAALGANANPLAVTPLDWSAAPGTIGQDYFVLFDNTTNTLIANYHNMPTFGSAFALTGLTPGHAYTWELIFDDYLDGSTYDSYGNLVDVQTRSDLRTLGFFTVPAGVPEPGAWVLLTLGVGLTGAALRRRGSATAALRP